MASRSPLAYTPRSWTWACDLDKHLESSHATYLSHLVGAWSLASQLLVAAIAGFIHAAFACFCPFIAEEVGAEVCVIATHLQSCRKPFDDDESDTQALSTPCYHDGTLRSKAMVPQRQGWPYAFSPHRWILYVDGSRHVRFSGGSYVNHARFAVWASAQFLVGAMAGYVHGLYPGVFPTLCEGIAIELGGLIIKRRKLRNLVAQQKAKQEPRNPDTVVNSSKSDLGGDVTLVNPDNLSDYFSEEFQRRFEEADKSAQKEQDVGQGLTLLAQGKVKVQLEPGSNKTFL